MRTQVESWGDLVHRVGSCKVAPESSLMENMFARVRQARVTRGGEPAGRCGGRPWRRAGRPPGSAPPPRRTPRARWAGKSCAPVTAKGEGTIRPTASEEKLQRERLGEKCLRHPYGRGFHPLQSVATPISQQPLSTSRAILSGAVIDGDCTSIWARQLPEQNAKIHTWATSASRGCLGEIFCKKTVLACNVTTVGRRYSLTNTICQNWGSGG